MHVKNLTDEEALALLSKMNFDVDPVAKPQEPELKKVESKLAKPFMCMSCGKIYDWNDAKALVKRERYITKNCPWCKSELIVRNVERMGKGVEEKYEPDVKTSIWGSSESRPKWGRR